MIERIFYLHETWSDSVVTSFAYKEMRRLRSPGIFLLTVQKQSPDLRALRQNHICTHYMVWEQIRNMRF